MDKLNSFSIVKNNLATWKEPDKQAPILPKYFASEEKPIIESSIDQRMDRQVKQDISIGNYNQENIRVLFQSPGGLNGTLWNTSLYPEQVKNSGWQRQESIAKNEMRIVATKMEKLSPITPSVLYQGLSIPSSEFQKIQETGYLQNYAFAFFSSNRNVAQYFSMHSGRQNDRKIIFQLTIADKDNEELQFRVGKVDFAAYTLLVQDKNNKFSKEDFNGLKEIIALPGNYFKVIESLTKSKNNFFNKLKKKLTKNNITTIYIQHVGHDIKPIQKIHSCYI
ncbi:hypothetical protein [Arsenophonus sp.]|uniref:hypothetical protein n=1 Tax=Arsenophonus sp. TaxID=1872640 RepID=UPI00286378AB|nr:hypothetical protein [Arsenophonus sp.]MDR5616659.1 hypothetical protein [Arsenophonus sp.]